MGIFIGTWMIGNEMFGGSGSGGEPIIDPSEMTPSEQEAFHNATQFAVENSSLFRNLFESLSMSNIIYIIRIGETKDDHPALTDIKNRTIVFRDENSLCMVSVFCEELFHAFQKIENASEYNSLEYNYEFEAKVFTSFVIDQIQMVMPNEFSVAPNFKGMMDFLQPNHQSTPIIENICPSFSTIHSPYFLIGYMKAAEYYYQWNKANNYGDENYRKRTLQVPHSLLKLSK